MAVEASRQPRSLLSLLCVWRARGNRAWRTAVTVHSRRDERRLVAGIVRSRSTYVHPAGTVGSRWMHASTPWDSRPAGHVRRHQPATASSTTHSRSSSALSAMPPHTTGAAGQECALLCSLRCGRHPTTQAKATGRH
ncbi:hypothetical protein BS78_07G053200 [Paspalum vaginatum]|nr:hypothetical protein BS78_07G053200 [Paspalum vaginatum]